MRKLVIALSLVGVLSLTSLVPVFADQAGACPPGFELRHADPHAGTDVVDRNGDGIICFKSTKGGHSVVIDNRIPL